MQRMNLFYCERQRRDNSGLGYSMCDVHAAEYEYSVVREFRFALKVNLVPWYYKPIRRKWMNQSVRRVILNMGHEAVCFVAT